MSNLLDIAKAAVQPNFNALNDLKEFNGDFASEEIGAALDCRAAQRTSMPPLWRPKTVFTIPNLAAVLQEAVAAKAQGNLQAYEKCMSIMLEFFLSGSAAPARSPKEVATAFQLQYDAALANSVEEEMPYLLANNLRQVFESECDIDQYDVLKEAESQRT
jgi:hypothetical protein